MAKTYLGTEDVHDLHPIEVKPQHEIAQESAVRFNLGTQSFLDL